MKEFLSSNWLAFIGALAWLPVLIELICDFFRRLNFVYLDRHIVHNSTTTFINNGISSTKNGMILLLALNISVYKTSYFPRKIICKITLKDKTKHKTKLYEGIIQYTETETFTNKFRYVFPDNFNMNTNRTIFADTDNIRIMPFFFENLSMINDENIKNIKLIFKGRFWSKSFKISKTDCTGTDFINQFAVPIK